VDDHIALSCVLSERASGTTVDAIAEFVLRCADLGKQRPGKRQIRHKKKRWRMSQLFGPLVCSQPASGGLEHRLPAGRRLLYVSDHTGGSLTDQYRLVGNYTVRILKGERPAGSRGLAVPPAMLSIADEVIE
jgi:hypothetical protein